VKQKVVLLFELLQLLQLHF